MNTIAISYRRFWLTRTRTGSFPEGWGDLTPAQFLAIASTNPVSEIRFMSLLTGFSRSILLRVSGFHRHMIMQLLSWVKTSGHHDSFIMGTIQVARTTLHSPENKLKHFTFGQFVFCDAWYIDYAATKNEDPLNKLVACLYLPQGKIFNEQEAMSQLHGISKLPIATREAIAINFQLVRQWLAINYPLIFPDTNPMPGREGKVDPPPAQSSWIKIFESIVGDDIINQDRYAALPLHNVLRFMTQKIKNAQR